MCFNFIKKGIFKRYIYIVRYNVIMVDTRREKENNIWMQNIGFLTLG